MLAAGSQANFFDTEGAEKNSLSALLARRSQRLRSRVLAVFEDADSDPKLVERGRAELRHRRRRPDREQSSPGR